jgi:hemoglobin-like flavoprotein
MTKDQREVFQQSLARTTTDPTFMERFYEHFLNSSPTIREKFKRTNWERQYRMMVESFEHLTDLSRSWTESDEHLRRLAAVHGKQGNKIPAWMYDNWLDSLLLAVAECDPEFDDDVAAAWRKTMWKGIAFMKARYGEELNSFPN